MREKNIMLSKEANKEKLERAMKIRRAAVEADYVLPMGKSLDNVEQDKNIKPDGNGIYKNIDNGEIAIGDYLLEEGRYVMTELDKEYLEQFISMKEYDLKKCENKEKRDEFVKKVKGLFAKDKSRKDDEAR